LQYFTGCIGFSLSLLLDIFYRHRHTTTTSQQASKNDIPTALLFIQRRESFTHHISQQLRDFGALKHNNNNNNNNSSSKKRIIFILYACAFLTDGNTMACQSFCKAKT